MAVGNALALIVAGGVGLGAVTSQAVPTRLVEAAQRPWTSPSAEAYPEIVAVNYDNGGGAYFAPRAYSAVEPVIRHASLDRYDDLPGDEPLPRQSDDVDAGNAELISAEAIPADEPDAEQPVDDASTLAAASPDVDL